MDKDILIDKFSIKKSPWNNNPTIKAMPVGTSPNNKNNVDPKIK